MLGSRTGLVEQHEFHEISLLSTLLAGLNTFYCFPICLITTLLVARPDSDGETSVKIMKPGSRRALSQSGYMLMAY